MKQTDPYFQKLIEKLLQKKNNLGGFLFNANTILEINLVRSLIDIDCDDIHVLKTLQLGDEKSLIDKDYFEKTLKEVISDPEVKDEKTTWEIIIPFEIRTSFKELNLNSTKFQIINFKTLKSNFPTLYYYSFQGQIIESKEINNSKIKYLVVESKGSTLLKAWKRIEPSFSILRGIIDFNLSYNRWITYFKPEERTSIPHPEVIFGISKSKENTFLTFMTQHKNSNIKTLTLKDNPYFRKLINFLSSSYKGKSTQELLSDIFRLYSKAMDEADLPYCYLIFWQIAERISLADQGGTINEQVKRKLLFYTEPNDEYNLKSYFDKLSTKRNKLVHRGIDIIEESDLNILKSICDYAILWIFKNRKSIKSINHLESFYMLRDKSSTELSTYSDIVNFIKKNRK